MVEKYLNYKYTSINSIQLLYYFYSECEMKSQITDEMKFIVGTSISKPLVFEQSSKYKSRRQWKLEQFWNRSKCRTTSLTRLLIYQSSLFALFPMIPRDTNKWKFPETYYSTLGNYVKINSLWLLDSTSLNSVFCVPCKLFCTVVGEIGKRILYGAKGVGDWKDLAMILKRH